MTSRFARNVLGCCATAALLVACGGGGDDPPPAATTPPATQQLTVSGKLVAPDGSTPIPNALVYVEGSVPIAGAPRVQALAATATCGAPPTIDWVATCTAADGSFGLTATVPASPKLVAVKGAFRLESTLTLPASGPLNLGTVAIKADTTGAKLAVVTGSFDRMQDILAKLGYGQVESGQLKLGTETFALFNGDGSLPASYKTVDALFADANGDGKADIFNYSIVFLNCGLNEATLGDAAKVAALRAFVEGGGRLYASDLAYDFVEQPFPAYIDFEGADSVPAAQPETPDVAELGDSGITSDATVDAALSSWLAGVTCGAGTSCLNANGTVHIEGFLAGWGVMKSAHSAQQANVRTWVSGPVTFSGQATPVVRPLTVSFPVGLGRVTYTSYHTEPGTASAGFLPQERILQFIVFEL